jgi:hypothetical protein
MRTLIFALLALALVLGGDMNFVFDPDGRVVRIFGLVDDRNVVWP